MNFKVVLDFPNGSRWFHDIHDAVAFAVERHQWNVWDCYMCRWLTEDEMQRLYFLHKSNWRDGF